MHYEKTNIQIFFTFTRNSRWSQKNYKIIPNSHFHTFWPVNPIKLKKKIKKDVIMIPVKIKSPNHPSRKKYRAPSISAHHFLTWLVFSSLWRCTYHHVNLFTPCFCDNANCIGNWQGHYTAQLPSLHVHWNH